MTETTQAVRMGAPVPDFTMNCYDPTAHDFTKISLAEIKKQKQWTILFFYPADFTFV